jgi:hypothetical protein
VFPVGATLFRRAAGERRRREFCVYFHYTIFFVDLSIGKLHNLFPGTLCILPIDFSVGLCYTIITVKGMLKLRPSLVMFGGKQKNFSKSFEKPLDKLNKM